MLVHVRVHVKILLALHVPIDVQVQMLNLSNHSTTTLNQINKKHLAKHLVISIAVS